MNNSFNEYKYNSPEKPLAGVRVLDMTHAYSGPFATMHLADQGAEVIKLEVPGKGDQTRAWEPIKNGGSGYFSYINRNKYGIGLNLKSEEGREIFKELIANVDVLVENFRVGTMEKLGLGYDVLREINPKLIYASISGFGLEGPDAKKPCYDIVAQAMGGMISMTGFEGNPVKVGPAIADNYSGTYLALGITMALFQRERTGLGRRLDVSMVDTIFSILETGVVQYTVSGIVSKPEGNRDPVIAPFDAFKAKDGMCVIACGTDGFFATLCSVMNMPELASDPRFISNSARCEHFLSELKPIIEEWTEKHTVDELDNMIGSAGIPFGKIMNIEQICNSDIIKNRNMLWSIDDPAIGENILVPGTPIKMHGCEDAPVKAAPILGQDTEDVLARLLNMDKEKIEELRFKNII